MTDRNSSTVERLKGSIRGDLVEYGGQTPTIESGIFVHPIDGACHDIAADGTAFPHREAKDLVGVYGTWPKAEDDDAVLAWVRRTYEALQPHYLESEYVNFVSEETSGGVQSVYGPNYERLVEVKRRYDPENLFRLNQNIQPDSV